MSFFSSLTIGDFFLVCAVFLNVLLGIIVFIKNRKSKINILFTLFILSISTWVCSNLLIDLKFSYEISLFFTRLTAVVNSFLPIFFLFFTINFPRTKEIKTKWVLLLCLPAVFLGILSVTNLVVVDINYETYPVKVTYGSMIIPLALYIVGYLGGGFVITIKKFFHETGVSRTQIGYLLSGLLVMIVVSIITNLILPLLDYSTFLRVGPSSTIVFSFFTAYAIVRYRLMDIRLIITRSLIYALLVVFVTGAFVLVTMISAIYFSDKSTSGQVGLAVVASLIIVLFLDPIKRILAKGTNKIFFKEAIDYPMVTKKITDVINEEIELDKLVNRFRITLEDDLRVKDVDLLLPVGKQIYISVEASEDTSRESEKKKGSLSIQRNSVLGRELFRSKNVIIIEELDRKVADAKTEGERRRFDAMRKRLEDIGAYAAVPVQTKDELTGVIILSRKLSGEAFSINDIQLLEVIAPQMASGIQKARMYQEEKEFGVKLQVEIKKATKELADANEKLMELDRAKSEFMSIASHQLRTPLAGVMGYLSMIIDGDYGDMAPEQEPILKSVLQATQRLIRMVNLFLNVTRIEAGRFIMNYKKVPFHETIQAMYDELKSTADKKDVKLVYKKTKLPDVEVDEDKIKDVLLNLIDNAIKYSPGGTVTISATANKKVVHFMVKDTGVGIPVDEVKNLFNKFVRGSGIAQVDPNGSGLGLFIAKKVTEGHGGNIWAESDGEGKGSSFHVEIPLKGDPAAKKKAEEFQSRAKKNEEERAKKEAAEKKGE